MSEQEFRDIITQNLELMRETSIQINKEMVPINNFFITLDSRDILIYSFSLGFYRCNIQLFGCSAMYATQKIKQYKYIKSIDAITSITISPKAIINFIAPTISYKTLRLKMLSIIDNLTGINNPSIIILDYLLLPEPDIIYKPR